MSPVLSASSADPLHVSGPAGRLLVTSADPLAVTAGRLLVTFERHPLAVTRCNVTGSISSALARQRTRCTSADPLAGCSSRQRTRWPSRPLAGCSSRLNVTGCPADRFSLVSGPVARQRTRWPVARHVWTSPVAPLAGCSSRQRTRWPSPLAGCSSRLNVTGCPAGRLLVTSADPLAVTAGRLLVTLNVTRCDPLHRLARHLHVSGPAGRLLVTSADPLKMALFAYSGEFPEFYLLSLNSNVYFNCSGETTSN